MKVILTSFILCGTTISSARTTLTFPTEGPPSRHFVSTQFVIHESNRHLLKRDQKLVREKFEESIAGFPPLRNIPFETHVAGNEVVFYMMTADDMQALMQQAIGLMIEKLNGRVRGRGLTSIYHADFPQPFGGYLDAVVHKSLPGVTSVYARGVMLREILAQLQEQLGGLSYSIPGQCAEKKVDWDFFTEKNSAPKPVEMVMRDLGSMYNLQVDKRANTYIFSGSCETIAPPPLRDRDHYLPFPPSAFMELDGPAPVREVSFPIRQLSR